MLLTPLDGTLPGWPHADNPSVIFLLLLLVGLPIAVAAVIAVLGLGGRWRRRTNDDAYAPDVRRSMALAGAPSDWAELEAGRENDTATVPLREGLAGERPEDRMIDAPAGATSVAKQESAPGDQPHAEPGILHGAARDSHAGRDATQGGYAGPADATAEPTSDGATRVAPRRAAEDA